METYKDHLAMRRACSSAAVRARLSAGIVLVLLATAQAFGDDPKPAAGTVSFERDVRPVLRKRCGGCHNPERPRGELDLTSYAAVMAGGASGKVAISGNADESPIYTLPSHLEDPHMPPNAPKIPQRELDVLKRWVEGGLIERSGETPAAAESTEPAGLVPPTSLPRAVPITALTTSPSAPLAMASGHGQILVFDLAAKKLLGALAFPEGDVFALKVSHDGRSLLAAGGIGAESGKVAVFRTDTWARAGSFGDETDAVLAADLSPDGSRIAYGGPGRVVKVVGNPGNQSLQTFRKPTDWVTATAFSPDGLLIAAGDRFGGLFLWEARTGAEFFTLRGHPKALTAIGWSPDSNQLVTAGEDGMIQTWDLHTGKVATRWDAHAKGVLALDVHRSGRIASAGRDGRVKVWAFDGRPIADLGPMSDQATRVAWSADGETLLSGDWSGEIRLWTLADSRSTALSTPVALKTASTRLVAPSLSPARRFTASKPATTLAVRLETSGDALQASLTSAREAAAAAEQTVARLSALIPPSQASASSRPSTVEALNAANTALLSLRAALALDPENASLGRAVKETEDAIRLLERKHDTPSSPGTSTAPAH
jgi:hypothetical protein